MGRHALSEFLLDADNRREMRAVADAQLTLDCDVQADTGEATASGGRRPTWTSADATVKCSLAQKAAGAEGQRQDQPQSIAQWTVRVPVGTVVAVANRLVISGADPLTSEVITRTLIVVSVAAPTTFEVARRVYCRDATAAEL